MSDLNKKIQDIMKDIEENISNEKDFKYISKKIVEVSNVYMEQIDKMNEIIQNKIKNIENIQDSIENKVDKIQTSITGIENDIYEDNFEFEIVCPYCNNEFTADIESKSDIKCPECQNIIELDWNEDEGECCSGSCSSCSSKCGELQIENLEDDDDDDM